MGICHSSSATNENQRRGSTGSKHAHSKSTEQCHHKHFHNQEKNASVHSIPRDELDDDTAAKLKIVILSPSNIKPQTSASELNVEQSSVQIAQPTTDSRLNNELSEIALTNTQGVHQDNHTSAETKQIEPISMDEIELQDSRPSETTEAGDALTDTTMVPADRAPSSSISTSTEIVSKPHLIGASSQSSLLVETAASTTVNEALEGLDSPTAVSSPVCVA